MQHGGPAWIEALRDRGGKLTSSAVAFARVGGGDPFPRGPEGMRALARRVRDYCNEDPPTTDEFAFLEGAGALLALLLLDHLGEGSYAREGERHGIRLAESFFDPFAAIDAAIDAEQPAAELARRVRQAEAEARGEGPRARVVDAFRRRLDQGRPDLEIRDVCGLHVTLEGGIEVDLARLARVADEERTLRAAVDKMIALLPGGAGDDALLAEASERVLPRLVGASFLRGLDAQARSAIHARPLGHDVFVALVLVYDNRSRFVRSDELATWGLEPLEAERLAVARLAARSETTRMACLDTDAGPLLVARTGDGHDAARLLLPGLAGVLAQTIAAPLLVAIPHRDVLFAAGGPGRAMLEARAREDHARAPHGITPALFRVAPGRAVEPA